MEEAARTNATASIATGTPEPEPTQAATEATTRFEPRGPSAAPPMATGGRLRAPTPRVALLLAASAIVVIVVLAAGDVLRPFVFGLLLAYLLDPLVERFARIGLPRGLAVLVVYAIALGILAGALALTIPPLVHQITTFADELPAIVRQLQYEAGHLNQVYDQLRIAPEFRAGVDRFVRTALDTLSRVDLGIVRPIFDSATGFITSLFAYLILPAWLFFLLKDRPKLQTSFDRALPPAWRRDTWAIVGIVHEVFGRWIQGQIMLSASVGLASFAGLSVLGAVVDPIFGRFAVLLAIVAALGELLPIIGPIISAVPAIVLGLTVGAEPGLAALALYFVIQQVENNVLVPKIQGHAIQLHATLVIVVLIVGGALFGLLGAVLALPVTAAFRDVFAYAFRRAGEAADEPTDPAADGAMASAASATSAAGGVL